MTVLLYAVERIKNCINELEAISKSEFPYADSREALNQLKRLFEDQLTELQQFDEKSNPAVVRQSCTISLDLIVKYLPLLGFILRSTNVRNGFEVCRPLLRLSKTLLEANATTSISTHLILSSEWDFSPFTYAKVPALPGFVLIGFPATESANPLILPLSGHEIGHSLWIVSNKTQKYQSILHDNIVNLLTQQIDRYNELFRATATPATITTDMFELESWAPAQFWVKKQVEETFCDFIGIRLFGTAYLYSFAYLIAPTWGSARPYRYPGQLTRVANMKAAATTYGVQIPENYDSYFEDLIPPRGTQTDLFLLEIADKALSAVVQEIVTDANADIEKANIPLPSSPNQQQILDRFHKVVPPENAESLADILNAAWLAAEDSTLWKGIPMKGTNRITILRDLVLKTIEILDINQTLKGDT